MRPARFLLACLLLAPVSLMAGEIHPLKGDPIKAEIVSVSDTEVVYEAGGKKQAKSTKEVLRIDYRETAKLPADATYSIIELTDGTALYAKSYSIKKGDVTMSLLSGPTVTVPLGTVAGILNRGEVEANRRDWKTRAFNERGKDALVLKRDSTISNLGCTFGEGTADGKQIHAAILIEDEVVKRTFALEKLHGMLFKNTLDPKAPVAACQLFDTLGNVVMVAGLSAREGGVTVTTPAGAKLEFGNADLSRIDYAKGKLDYLGDLPPLTIVARSNLDEDAKPDQWHVYKNTNLNGKPISLGGVVYSKGLAIKPYTELTFDLRGDYRELSMLVGIDDNVSADGAAILVLEVDGKEISTLKIGSGDKVRFKPVSLNIKDAQKLKVTVKSDGDFDTSRHLDLADAKVSK